MEMNTFTVWTLWADLSEVLVTVRATDADAAIVKAVGMGLVSGLGRRPSYLGLHAVAA
jgi:hypothetical protein